MQQDPNYPEPSGFNERSRDNIKIMAVIDVINNRYVDKAKLNRLLTDLFGANNFEVDVRRIFGRQAGRLLTFLPPKFRSEDHVILTTPRKLSEVCST